MDRVLIEALKVEVNIGIFEWEQRIRQPVIFDLELAVDTARAATSDRIEDTVDYKAVSGRICALATGRCWGLVETLAEATAQCLREEFGIGWVRVTVRKQALDTNARTTGAVIERSTINDS